MSDLWNKCDVCGRIIPYADLESGKALHRMVTPDSDVSSERFETICRGHYSPEMPRIAPRIDSGKTSPSGRVETAESTYDASQGLTGGKNG